MAADTVEAIEGARMKAKARPLLGAFLGLLLGLTAVALLSQTGVLPPDRLWLFGIVGVAIMIVTGLTTQRASLAKKRFVTTMILGGILVGVALSGIPETVNGGTISDGCTLEAQSSVDEATPQDTSAFDPIEVQANDTVTWTASSEEVVSNGERALGVMIGGFLIPVWSATLENSEGRTEFAGDINVAQGLLDMKDATGLDLRGAFHFSGYLDGEAADCEMSGYVRVLTATPFTTGLQMGLWGALGVIVICVAWAAIAVRRSISQQADGEGTVSGTAGTGGAAAPDLDPPAQTVADELPKRHPDSQAPPQSPNP